MFGPKWGATQVKWVPYDLHEEVLFLALRPGMHGDKCNAGAGKIVSQHARSLPGNPLSMHVSTFEATEQKAFEECLGQELGKKTLRRTKTAEQQGMCSGCLRQRTFAKFALGWLEWSFGVHA